jgi:hypothetical protein
MTKITGQTLLQHRADCLAQGMKAGEIARTAGYVGQRKDGTERIHFTEFYEEVLIAQGKMHRINISMAEMTPMGIQPVYSNSFTTFSRDVRTISRKVRQLTNLTKVRCKRTVHNGVVVLYPYHSDEIVSYNIPA